MGKVLRNSKFPLAFCSIALLALTACSSQETGNVAADSAPSASATASATPSATPSATRTATPRATATASAQPSPSVHVTSAAPEPVEETEAAPTQAPTSAPVVQEEVEPTQAPQPAATTTAPAVQQEPTVPAPTGSVITVPAPGNNPVASAEATQSVAPTQAAGSCDYANIHIAAETTEGAAGSRYITLTFTNAGSSPCALSGWPSVSYVDASGNTIGAPASQAAEWTNSGEMLASGQSAKATLRETRAGLYGDTCQAVTAAGYRVGIPGTENSLVLNFPAEACSNQSITQLSVGQVGANS